MWKRLLVGALLVGGGVGSAGLGWVYLTVVAPMRSLPRPAAAIETDWAAAERRMPALPVAGAEDEALNRLVQALQSDNAPAEDAEAFALWIDEGHRLPPFGCTMLSAHEPGPHVSTMSLYSASNALVAHGHPDAAWELAEQLRTRELLGLMVASAIWKTVEPERTPNPAYLFDALAMEARCGDATIGAMLDGSLDSAAGDAWLLDFGIERLKYRDHMARLLLELDPIRDDAAQQRAVLAAFAEPMPHAPLAGILAYGLHRVADDYLTPPAPPEHP